MKNIKSTVVAMSLFVFSAAAQSTGLVASQKIATVSAEQFNRRLAEVFKSDLPQLRGGSLGLYKVSYRSADADGRGTILSGLVVVPSNGAPKGLVVFNHGTAVYNGAMPSRFAFTVKGGEPETAVLAFGSGGYAIAMPDYLGQGDNLGRGHPYPANVVNARAGIDLIKPARELASRNNIAVGSDLFITGYSEGGGVAMAQTRELERLSDRAFRVTAAAPASGPYDLTGATRDFMISQPTDQAGFVVRTYLLGSLAYYLKQNRDIKITEYFKPSMAFTVNTAYSGKIKDEDIIKRIGLTAVLMRAKNNIFNVITPRFRQAIVSLDTRDAAVKLLKDNNTYDWLPKSKMLLISLEGDAIVSPVNSQVALDAMRRRGAGRQQLRRSIIRDASLNHITAVPEAMLRARLFFDGGFQNLRDLDEN